jgi:hypothetical protein
VINERGAVAAWEDPTWKRTWQSEQAWRCPLAGPFSAFGQVGASSDEAAQREMKVAGRTGLSCQIKAPFGAELLVRGGPSVNCTDPLRPERMQAQQEVLVEVKGRLPLVWGIGLEYQGSAVPALTPLERDRVQHDVRLAFPLGESGKLNLGARRRWENAPEARPVVDGMQLYLGVERGW